MALVEEDDSVSALRVYGTENGTSSEAFCACSVGGLAGITVPCTRSHIRKPLCPDGAWTRVCGARRTARVADSAEGQDERSVLVSEHARDYYVAWQPCKLSLPTPTHTA